MRENKIPVGAIVFLERYNFTPCGIFGRLMYGADLICYTLERPYEGNQEQVSSIPMGQYPVTPHDSLDHPNTFLLHDVPGRDGILIHVGNTIKDSKGCILVGTDYNANGVLHSRDAMQVLNNLLPQEGFKLDIRLGHSE